MAPFSATYAWKRQVDAQRLDRLPTRTFDWMSKSSTVGNTCSNTFIFLAVSSSILSKDVIDEVLSTLATGGDSGENVFTFIDAFQMPKFDYDPVRKAFHHSSAKLSIHADAKSKTALYRDRFTLLQQRVLRQEAFTKPALGLKRAEDTQTAEVGKALLISLPRALMHRVSLVCDFFTFEITQ